MKSFEVRRQIAAPPERVWEKLTDGDALVSGGLGVMRLEGKIGPGAKLKVWSEANPGRAFALSVTVFTPPQRMVWSGGMPFGLFKGVRTYSLTPRDGGTEFHMCEEFSGPMLALIGPTIPDLNPSFAKFAEGLGRLAEGGR